MDILDFSLKWTFYSFVLCYTVWRPSVYLIYLPLYYFFGFNQYVDWILKILWQTMWHFVLFPFIKIKNFVLYP